MVLIKKSLHPSPFFNAGIMNSVGKLWRNERRFLHEKLRDLGMTYMGSGRKLMESRIMVSCVFGSLVLLAFFTKAQKIYA